MNNSSNEVSKCTLCAFKSNGNSSFQHHLMETHGIKLKSLLEEATIADDYALGQKFNTKEYSKVNCTLCGMKLDSDALLKSHMDSCGQRHLNRVIQRGGKLPVKCDSCQLIFRNSKHFRRHSLTKCKVPKNICCLLCPFKAFTMGKLSRHTITKHNLIAKPVDEVNFEQAIDNAPYTLERPIVVDTLPDIKAMEDLWNKGLFGPNSNSRKSFRKVLGISGKEAKIYICPKCKMEFAKPKHLNKHIKFKIC